MAIYNVLNWQNENALSSYPLNSDVDVQDFIVDARFVQFDNFVPVLNYVKIDSDRITLAITFDYGQHTAIEFFKSTYDNGEKYRVVRIYSPIDNRYMGSLTFGQGAAELWTSYVGRKLVYNISFAENTVRSIPSQDAVYTLDGNYGVIALGRTDSDTTIFYNCVNSSEDRSVVFNAVGGHAVSGNKEGLRKINLVTPLNNNINLASNDVIKISSFNAASLTIDLVAGSPSTAFIIPTLA